MTETTPEERVNERRWERVLLVLTAFLLVVLLVVVTALEIQVQSRNKDIRIVQGVAAKAQAASERAETASTKSLQVVNEAIAAGNKNSATLTPQVVKAFATIGRIEQDLQLLLDKNGVSP